VVFETGEDDVLVPVVIVRHQTDLAPLPADEGRHVGVLDVSRYRVALADRVRRLPPAPWGARLRMIVDGPEVEGGAEAGVVAGIAERMRPLALQHWQAPQEGIGREGGVDVEVAKEDLLGLSEGQRRSGALLRAAVLLQHRLGNRRRRELPGALLFAIEPEPGPGHVERRHPQSKEDDSQDSLSD